MFNYSFYVQAKRAGIERAAKSVGISPLAYWNKSDYEVQMMTAKAQVKVDKVGFGCKVVD